jgi:hypothetical protein
MNKKTFIVVVILGLAISWILIHQMVVKQDQAPKDQTAAQESAPARNIAAEATTPVPTAPIGHIEGKFLSKKFDVSRYSLETQGKLKTLAEIMGSKNDNDPRLDTDLKNLTEQDKVALKDFYSDLKLESLNERGTVVFLMGRSIQGPEDLDYMKDVLAEDPCMSLDNCTSKNVAKDTHLDSMDETTMSYPQQIALESISRYTQSRTMAELSANDKLHLIQAIQEAKRSPIYTIQRKADDLSKNLRL